VSNAQFQTVFTRLFDRIGIDDPDRMDELVEQEMVVRFRLREPNIDLGIDGRANPAQTSFVAQKFESLLHTVPANYHELVDAR
jgi:hypothetical protein|tara:strand:+ start:10214 stop:10462 length:249 start_codon:yes stop_codon:yes gene_type:complete